MPAYFLACHVLVRLMAVSGAEPLLSVCVLKTGNVGQMVEPLRNTNERYFKLLCEHSCEEETKNTAGQMLAGPCSEDAA